MHLKPVTSLVVDPSTNFVLSGSSDANVHVWSLVDLLSFSVPAAEQQQRQKTSIRVFSNHRAEITSLAVGHSSGRYNIAVSASRDRTAMVWNYRTGEVLRIFLLPLPPLCLTLDPADRTCYVGYEDGSVQMISFYRTRSVQHPLHDPSLQYTPTQLSEEDRWFPPSSSGEFGAVGPVRTLTLSYDGTILLSGHESGKVLSWNIARGKYASNVADYGSMNSAVTNLVMLPPMGLLPAPKRVANTVVKPRPDVVLSGRELTLGAVPAEYAFSWHVVASLANGESSGGGEFSQALNEATFPESLIEEGLAQLKAESSTPQQQQQQQQAPENQPLTNGDNNALVKSLEEEINKLNQRFSVSEAARWKTTHEVANLRSQLANVDDYLADVQTKQAEALQAKVARQARKEEREASRREAWFEAERRGRTGDQVLREMESVDSIVTSDTDEQGSDGS